MAKKHKVNKYRCWICNAIVKDKLSGVYKIIRFASLKGNFSDITLSHPTCSDCVKSLKFWVKCRNNGE